MTYAMEIAMFRFPPLAGWCCIGIVIAHGWCFFLGFLVSIQLSVLVRDFVSKVQLNSDSLQLWWIFAASARKHSSSHLRVELLDEAGSIRSWSPTHCWRHRGNNGVALHTDSAQLDCGYGSTFAAGNFNYKAQPWNASASLPHLGMRPPRLPTDRFCSSSALGSFLDRTIGSILAAYTRP